MVLGVLIHLEFAFFGFSRGVGWVVARGFAVMVGCA